MSKRQLDIDALVHRFPLVSEQVSRQEITIILQQLVTVLEQQVRGAIVEFGCYNGTTSLFIMRCLQMLDPSREFHVYDSFQGLPDKTALDQSPAGSQFTTGALAARKRTFIQHFAKAGLPLPIIHKGWFEQLAADEVPSPIAFAFLDGDYFSSIQTSLQLITPKLSPGAHIVIDDYQSEALPGVTKAVDHWLQAQAGWRLRSEASLAIIFPV